MLEYYNMKRTCVAILVVLFSSIVYAQKPYDVTVAADGSGDFSRVQDAFNAVPDFRKNITTIFIKKGVYKEKLILSSSKTNVHVTGEDVNSTVLTFDDFASKKNRFGEEMGTSGSTSFFVFADGFKATNLTFENSSGPVGQAVAVRIDGDKVIFDNCRFLGFQDTLYPHGEKSRQLYRNCYIEGTVDFIFGWSTAVFQHCTIFCKKGGGYITAASTTNDTSHGFVFFNCRITGDAEPNSFYLGRPWRPHAKTIFVNCFLDNLIRPEGWHNWNKPDAEATAYYGEFKSSGPGAHPEKRVDWSHKLTDDEAAKLTPQTILAGEDNWQID